jgi:hypothetical protein
MFNNNWGDEVRRSLEQAVSGAMQDKTREMQAQMDRFARQYKGRPVSVIKPALKREWERDGGKITDPELTEWATHISEGRPIKFRYKAA